MDAQAEIRKLNSEQSWRTYQVDYPAGSLGRFSVEVFDIAENDQGRLKYILLQGPLRDPGHGRFRRLVERTPDGRRKLWMSDTRAEIMEHAPVLNRLRAIPPGASARVLVNGLGLGVVVHAALMSEGVAHVDVVEKDATVAQLIGRHFPDDRVTVTIGDAFGAEWPDGTRWDLAWHDIWADINDLNLPGMHQLTRKYRGRAGWQGCWQRDGCIQMLHQRMNGDPAREP